ncbi:DUF6207 family protein [Streptomyces longisporoflavus]|uniref:DUF6207 family protein n=1 Tax=Streptomyces longisporoflavus TaxID=28044 RepID=A0ABW7QIN1_9ACTN
MSHSAHLTQPDLARITVHCADAETASAVAYAIAAHLNATGPSEPYRIPGEAGMCVSQYAYEPEDGGPVRLPRLFPVGHRLQDDRQVSRQ